MSSFSANPSSFLTPPPATRVVIDPIRAIVGVGVQGGSSAATQYGIPNAGAIVADAVIEENHLDESEITRHPIEGPIYGTVSDNVIDLPQEVTLTYGWGGGSPQNSATVSIEAVASSDGQVVGSSSSTMTVSNPHFLQAIYAQLLALKQSKIPFTIYTGKRVYTSMLIRSLTTTTDIHTENALIVRLTCYQLIVVSTTTFSLQSNPASVSDPSTNLAVSPLGNQPTTATPLPSVSAFQNSLSSDVAKQFPFPEAP